MTVTTITLRRPIDPPIAVRGTGAWSNTGRLANYTASAIYVDVSHERITVTYGGAKAGRGLSGRFWSDDRALDDVKRSAVAAARRAYASASW